jgi:hypothetical protein
VRTAALRILTTPTIDRSRIVAALRIEVASGATKAARDHARHALRMAESERLSDEDWSALDAAIPAVP